MDRVSKREARTQSHYESHATGVVSLLFVAVDSGEETGTERVRRVRAADWRALRRCRLQALSLDAESFGTSLDEAAKRPVDHWRDLARQHSRGPDRAILLAIDDPAGHRW